MTVIFAMVSCFCLCCVFIIAVAVFERRKAGNLTKNLPKSFLIGITTLRHYFFYRFPAGLKGFLSSLYLPPLGIFGRRVPGCFNKAPVKVAPADSQAGGQVFGRDIF